jgi:cytidylate kinase
MTHRLEPVILTITRQMASGGSYIGYAVARRLRLRCMDRAILRRAARALGADDCRTLESLEETKGSIWARLTRGMATAAPFVSAPLGFDEDDVFDVESHIIREIAEYEDAVFVGHGAGFVLRNHPGVIRVFVHAPEPWRIAAAQRSYAVDPAAARDLIRQSDKRRARFIEGLSGAAWTDARLYDLSVDTSAIDIGGIIAWLAEVVQGRLERRKAVVRIES